VCRALSLLGSGSRVGVPVVYPPSLVGRQVVREHDLPTHILRGAGLRAPRLPRPDVAVLTSASGKLLVIHTNVRPHQVGQEGSFLMKPCRSTCRS